MRRSYFASMFAALALLASTPRLAQAELLFADDFLYHETTKTLGPGGGFQRQDYGGGQNGTAGSWAGRWVSVGDAIILGEDIADREAEFPNLNADSDAHWALTQEVGITVQWLERPYSLVGVPNSQTLYFGFTTRTATELDAVDSMFQINDPGTTGSLIGFGLGEGGIQARIGDQLSSEAASVADAAPHRLIGKLEVNAVGTQERLSVWLDPTGVEAGGTSIDVVGDMITGLSDLTGSIQMVGGGPAILWDDVAVGTTWADVASVSVPRLSLQVDPGTGNVSLLNASSKDFNLNYYEILSASGSIDSASWQSVDGAVAGDGKWEKNLGSIDPTKRIAESSFVGGTLLPANGSFSLGKAFKANGTRDLIARFGTTDGLLNVMSVSYGAISLKGDFNNDGSLTAADIDALTVAINAGNNPPSFDLNGDNQVNGADHTTWVKDLKRTWFGDANLDGQFDSTDFVAVFQVGEYEDAAAGNSTWAEGDWNGDRDFNSGDFITAFQDGGFEQGPRPAVAAVPEPASAGLTFVALASMLLAGRRGFRKF